MLNAMVAAGTSYAESRPILILSSGLASSSETDGGELHDTKDTFGAMSCMTQWSTRATTPREVSEAIARAFKIMATGRPRPVYIEVPHDVLAAQWNGVVATAEEVPVPELDTVLVQKAIALISGAQHPAIVAGGGSRGAAEELRLLAEKLSIPVITTSNGKGTLSEEHPLSLGANIRLVAAQDWLNNSDALLVVGSELSDSDLFGGRITAPSIVRIDIDENQLQRNAPAAVGILGDAAEALSAISAGLAEVNSTSSGYADIAELKASLLAEARQDGELWFELNSELRKALPSETIVTGDSSQVTYFGTVHFFPVPARDMFLYMPRAATLGYAVPAALGAKIAKPDAPVVAVLGDGALMFSVQEMITAIEHEIPIVIVVANNGGYREIKDQQAALGISPVGVDLFVPDLAGLASAMGMTGERATSAKDAAERASEALRRQTPTLICLDL
jgi:acetolactate synthase-1/2/3 large subunit